MATRIYINGIGSISAQSREMLSKEPALRYSENVFPAIPPNFKEFIKPMALRRMSKAVKMGISSAKIALKEAEIETPDAIITGTGEGCKQDTENFLENMLNQDEKLLAPTAFIQSTHNTIGGQIALNLNCKNYNVTYTQNSVSLETAFIDALMQLNLDPEVHSVLVGGVDEISKKTTAFRKLDGQLKQVAIKNLNLFKENSPGTITSEGAHFFALAKEKGQHTYAELKSVSIENEMQPKDIGKEIITFLQKNNLDLASIDAVILGNNGDNRYDNYYKILQENLFKKTIQLAYKHLVGDFDTASGYAVFLAANILKSGEIPEVLKLQKLKDKPLKNILIYNQYLGRNHSLILLSAV